MLGDASAIVSAHDGISPFVAVRFILIPHFSAFVELVTSKVGGIQPPGFGMLERSAEALNKVGH